MKDQARMGSSSMPGGSTPVSSANMMSGQFVGKLPFWKKKKGRSQLFFLVLVPVCGLVCGLPLLYNDYVINILTHVALFHQVSGYFWHMVYFSDTALSRVSTASSRPESQQFSQKDMAIYVVKNDFFSRATTVFLVNRKGLYEIIFHYGWVIMN